MQGELVGDFWETDIYIRFRWLIEDFSRSPNSISLGRIFRGTIIYDASDGASLRSLASLWLEFCKRQGRHVGTQFGRNPESHDFNDF